MPQLGETVNEGTVAAWHKNVGDEVTKGEILLDVETDKVATEIEAPGSGVLKVIQVAEGETVDVGVVLAEIDTGDAATEAVPAAGAEPPAKMASAPAKALSQAAEVRPAAADAKMRLSPAVRRLVADHDLDLSSIAGTGRNGRVTRQDILQAIDNVLPTTSSGEDTCIPFDRIRRVTAEHMVRSKAISPHVLQAIEVDFTAVEQARLPRREQWRADNGYSLSYLPFIARAVCIAIREFPRVNASVVDDALEVHADINFSIAIDLNHEGLVAPVIPKCGDLKVSDLAARINDLVTRARTKRLVADDFKGGTYTLSNPGPYGTLFTAPIINQPQVGILSTDAVMKRATVVTDENGDAIAIRPIGVLAQTFDHRAFDGAYSAAFLGKIKSTIESTDWNAAF